MRRARSFEKSRLPDIQQDFLSPEQQAFLEKNKRRSSGYKKKPSLPPSPEEPGSNPLTALLSWFGGSPTAGAGQPSPPGPAPPPRRSRRAADLVEQLRTTARSDELNESELCGLMQQCTAVASDAQQRAKLVEAGGVESLVQMLRHSAPAVQEAAAGALS
jgi:hypothetical protein